MKKILIAWIAVLFIVCIAARFLVKGPEKKEVATATLKVAKVVIPEKKAEVVEKPKIAEEPKVVEKTIRVEPEKPEEVEKLKAEIAALGQKIKVLEETKKAEVIEESEAQIAEKPEIRRYEPDESIHAELKTERQEIEQTEEPVYYEPEVIRYERPFVFPIVWLDLAINPFWYNCCWDWYYSGLYCYSYLGLYLGWHPFWGCTRAYYDYFPYGYEPFYRGGRTVIRRSELKDSRYQSQNLRSSMGATKTIQTGKISKTGIYPSRIGTSGTSASSTGSSISKRDNGRKDSPWGTLDKPDSSLKKSVASGSSSKIYPNRRSSSKSRATKSFLEPSPKSFSKSPSGSFRFSSGSSRSSSRPSPSVRSAPSRSSGSIRKK